MYIKQLKEALGIRKHFTIDNLQKLFESGETYTREKTYKDLPDMYNHLRLFYAFPYQLISNSSDDPYALYSKQEKSYLSHLEKVSISQSLLSESDPIDKDIEFLTKHKPNEQTPSSYMAAYYRVVLNWFLDSKDDSQYATKLNAIQSEPDPMIALLDNAYQLALNYSSLVKKQKESLASFKYSIRFYIRKLVHSKKTTDTEYEMLRLYGQLLVFINSIETNLSPSKIRLNGEVLSYLAFYIAEAFYPRLNKLRSSLRKIKAGKAKMSTG